METDVLPPTEPDPLTLMKKFAYPVAVGEKMTEPPLILVLPLEGSVTPVIENWHCDPVEISDVEMVTFEPTVVDVEYVVNRQS